MKKFILVLSLLLSLSGLAALTVVSDGSWPCGNKICGVKSLTFTSVTGGAVVTGLNDIVYASYSPTASASPAIIYLNSASASSTEDDLGQIYLDGVTSNDTGLLFYIGR